MTDYVCRLCLLIYIFSLSSLQFLEIFEIMSNEADSENSQPEPVNSDFTNGSRINDSDASITDNIKKLDIKQKSKFICF